MQGSEIVGMWGVALALVGVIGVQSVMPGMQPRLAQGFQASSSRDALIAPGGSPAAIANAGPQQVIRCAWRSEGTVRSRNL
jgi:hypothetical protein